MSVRTKQSGNTTIATSLVLVCALAAIPGYQALGSGLVSSIGDRTQSHNQASTPALTSQSAAGVASAADKFARLSRQLQDVIEPLRKEASRKEQAVIAAKAQVQALQKDAPALYASVPSSMPTINIKERLMLKLARTIDGPEPDLTKDLLGEDPVIQAFVMDLVRDYRSQVDPAEWASFERSTSTTYASEDSIGNNLKLIDYAVYGSSDIRTHIERAGQLDDSGELSTFASRIMAVHGLVRGEEISEELRKTLFPPVGNEAMAKFDEIAAARARLAKDAGELAAAQKRLTDAEAKVGEFDAFIAATRGYEADTRDALWTQVVAPFRSPDAMAALGMRAEQGFIFYGPPGTGKTYLAKKLSELLGGKGQFEIVKGSEFESKWVGESQQNLRKLFDDAAAKAKDKPYVLVFDELDAALPESNGLGNEAYRSAVRGQFLSLMADALEKNPNLLVIGTTNRLSKIDPGLRRPGRFGAEIKIGNPSEQGRLDALEGMFGAANYDVDLAALAKSTAGYSFADLDALVNAAKQRAFGGSLFGKQLRVTEAHLKAARGDYLPTALRENSIAISPGVRFSDVGGLEDVIAELKRNIQFPILEGERLSALGQTPRIKSTLLYGPPGNGKTFVVNALANETQANVIAESASVIKSPEDVRELFERAKNAEPSIIVIDEIEAIVPRRGAGASYDDKIVNEFLAQMSGVSGSGKVAVIGMTNRRELIDPAVLRAGRLESQLFIGLPDQATRRAVLENKTKKLKLAKGSHAVDLDAVAAQTNGYSGADLDALVYEASFLAAERGAKTVSKSDFDSALAKVKPSVSKEDLATYTQDPQRAFPVGFTANN